MPDDESPKLGIFPYILAGLSFIPAVGMLFGSMAIVWGLVTPKPGGKRLAMIGAAGIAVTVAIYGTMFYFMMLKNGGPWAKLNTQMAQMHVTQLVPWVEFFKLQNARFPESMEELKEFVPKDIFISVVDPLLAVPKQPDKSSYYYYERVGDDHYYLRSVGEDRQPFTADDLVPQIILSPDSRSGLLLDRKPES